MFRKKVLREKEISADNKEGFLSAYKSSHLPWQKTAQNEESSSENVSASGEKSDTRRSLLLALAVTMATASAEPLEDTNSDKVPGDETTLSQRWSSVSDAGPALRQRWVWLSCQSPLMSPQRSWLLCSATLKVSLWSPGMQVGGGAQSGSLLAPGIQSFRIRLEERIQVKFNPYNAEIFLYIFVWRPKGFFNLKSSWLS